MICPECGNRYLSNTRWCPYCGCVLSARPVPEEKTSEAEPSPLEDFLSPAEGLYEQEPDVQPAETDSGITPEREAVSDRKKRRRGKRAYVRILICSAVLALLASGLILWFGLSKQNGSRDFRSLFTNPAGGTDSYGRGKITGFTAEYFPEINGESACLVFYADATEAPSLFCGDQVLGVMHDDGQNGDTREGDGTYSYTVRAWSDTAKTLTYCAGFDSPETEGIDISYQ